MSAWGLLIPFAPVAKGRARVARTKDGGVRHYTPEATADFEALVETLARAYMRRNGLALTPAPVELRLAFVLPVPESWPAWKREHALMGLLAPTTKPDLDNLEKCVMDALNGLAWVDDAQVVDVVKSKRYGVAPGVHLTVTPLTLLPAQVSRRPIA